MDFSELKGKVIVGIEKVSVCDGDELRFLTADGETFVMLHYQDCCESVYIESIDGDLEDVTCSPILHAECVSGGAELKPPLHGGEESYTWTFYKLATINGSVTIRWYGSSNGYYSESVDFKKINH